MSVHPSPSLAPEAFSAHAWCRCAGFSPPCMICHMRAQRDADEKCQRFGHAPREHGECPRCGDRERP